MSGGRLGEFLIISLFFNIVGPDLKSKNTLDPDEILLAAAVATVPCVLFDHLLYSIQNWQRKRAGVVMTGGFGAFGRTVISIVLNFFLCGVVAYVYRSVGHEPQDAFLVGACLWLIVSVPVLFTSRYVDETQRQYFAGRILGWLAKTAIASACAAYFVTFGGT